MNTSAKRRANVRYRYAIQEISMIDMDKEIPGAGEGEGGGSGDVTPDLSLLPKASFALSAPVVAEELPEYGSSRSDYPVAMLTLSHSASDAPRTHALLTGDYSQSPPPPSAALLKEISSRLNTLTERYYDAASLRGLVTSPLRIGAALRFSDGSRLALGDAVTLIPDAVGPGLAIRSYSCGETLSQAQLTIRNIPKRPRFSLPPFSSGLLASFTAAGLAPLAVDFYTSAQAPFSDIPFSFQDVRTVVFDEGPDAGTHARCFVYDRYEADYVRSCAERDRDLRIVGEIPFEDISGGCAETDVPLYSGALFDRSSLALLTWKAGAGSDPGEDTPDDPYRPYIHWMTPPLDLGDPETEKRVRGVTLRGVFPRDGVKLTLFGSHHREHWWRVAESEGPVLRFLCGMRFRWWRVEIETAMRRGDALDALLFTLLRT